MPTFTYEAMNSVGQPVKGNVEAASSDEAIAKVRAKGNFPTKIKKKVGRRGAKATPEAATQAGARKRSVGRVSAKLLAQFTRQLSTLVNAGLPIVRSLEVLQDQQKPGPLRVAIRMVKEDVTDGSSLSDAMKRHPKAFDKLYTNMVRAGELGGVLDVILQRLSEFMEKAESLKRKVKGAMVYPVAVITFAILIVTVLMIFVVPQFEKIFSDMGQNLPAITRSLLNISSWISKDGGWAVILGFPFGLFLLIKLLKQSSAGAMFVDRVNLNIPIMGKIIAKTAVARFSRTLGTLLAAGVPILEALHITRETSGNEVFARAIHKVHGAIREGENFATPLRQTRVVDPMVVNMIDVGEETGELDKMLSKIADIYDDEVDTMVAAMTSLMEPVLVVTLGCIVGYIVVALFMPMVGMLDVMQGG
ncbi:MAG: type II secretion system F family protein [Phycisphaerae bacterium]|jgi:type IV pilus assembly protein PilC|nr:type II secretion system F family protein [Phycisphaerae bacterium]